MGDPIVTSGSASPDGGVVGGVVPPPTPVVPPLAAPIRVDSPHCLDTAITDFRLLGDTLAGNPCTPVMTELLPQILDHGNTEIQFEAPLNVGEYRGGVAVERPTWMHARLWMEDGRLRGTIDFFPPITKRNGIVGIGDASLSQLQITTDASGNVRFSATATFLNLSVPLIGDSIPMNVTEELTETLFGTRMSSIPGPLSRVLQTFLTAQAAPGSRLENLVRMDAARFRIVGNPQPGDPPVPGLGDVSNASFRIPELRVSPTVTMRDVSLRLEIWPNEETGGFRVVIPEARVGEIRHAPTEPCNGAPNPGSTVSNVRLENVTLNLDPRGDRNALGNDMFQAMSQSLATIASLCSGQPTNLAALANTQPLYPASGSGRILFGGANIQNDIVVNPIEGDRAVTFSLTGQANGDLSATIDAPEIGLDRAAVLLGGEMLLGHTGSINLDDALIRNLHATVNLRSGAVSYNASFTPTLAQATLSANNPGGNLLAGATLMGFTSGTPVRVEGSALGTADESHRVRVDGARLDPSRMELHNPIGATGEASFGFSGLGLDATFTKTGMRLNRLVLPDYELSADVTVGRNRIRTSITNGRATDRILAGLGLVLDETGPNPGITHTASVNTRVERLRFSTPEGVFEMTGTLTGTMGLLDKHTDTPGTFTPPDFRPTAGGMRLSLNGTVRQIGGSGLRLSGHISIRDTASGRVTISGGTSIPTDDGTITARTSITANLHDQLQTFTYVATPGGGGEGGTVSYYDFDPNADTAIPLTQILVEAAVPGVGTLRTVGSGRISGLPRNPNFEANLPFGTQHLDINRPDLPVTGTVDLTGGGLDVRGSASRITVGVRPPETVHVAFTQVSDGVTYTYAGDLRSRSSFTATIHPRTGRVSFREVGGAPQLTGDLTVTATTVRDGNTVTLGSGSVHVSTTYALSGRADASSAHLELSVPETGLTGEVTSAISLGENTIPAGTRLNIPIRNFSGVIDLNPRSLAFTSTWTAGDIGPARVEIPSLSLPGGINFSNVTVELSALAHGQQWRVERNAAGAVSFNALAGAGGHLPPFEVNLGLRDGTGTNLSLTVGSSSRADSISGTVDPATGETVLDVRGMTLTSRVGGSATISDQRIDLTGLTTDANVPTVQLRINGTTGAMRVVVTPPVPTGVTHPPTDLSSWMGWTTDQWRDYQTQMNGTTHLAVLSEVAMNAPAAGAIFPQGRGRIYVDMPSLELTANINDPASVTALMGSLQDSLIFRREFPNPPARDGSGEPILLSDAQRPLYRTAGAPGTLYFISESRADGPPRLDPDLSRNLEEALGIPRAEADRIVASGRMEMDDLIARIRSTPAIRAAISEDDLTTLVTSYLGDTTGSGSFRRFSNRMIITLGNIRAQLARLGTVGAGGLRGIHAHAFADPSYHRAPAPNDGTDMQFLAVIPVAPSALARIIETNPSSAWDPWASGGVIDGSTETGTLLNDHSFRVSHAETRDGNVRVIRITPTGSSAMVAASRTIRIVPTSGGGSLLIMDQHEDYPGTDIDIRVPRMRLPDRPPINLETVGTGALGALRPTSPDLATYYANRFAGMAENLMELGTGTRTSGVDFDSRSSITRTAQVIEFLSLDVTDAANPSLRISADATAGVIRPMLTSRLGVNDAVANRWISARRIPLSELMTETGLATSFETATIQAVAEAVLNPPATITDTMRHFSAPTERFLVMIEDLRTASAIRGSGTGDSFSCRVRGFLDPKFHGRSTAQPDTIDNLMYWFVPGDLGVTPAHITGFVHAASRFPAYSASFAPSRVVPPSEISGAVAGRVYTDTGVVTPSSNFNYRISVPTDPITLSGGVLLSPWRQEDRPGARDFLDNQGWWITLPMREGGFIVVRGGVINTRLGTDRDPTVSSAALNDVISFMTAVLNGAQDDAGVAARRRITYSRGTVVSERNASIF